MMIDFKAMESYLETREKKQIFISPETELKKNDMLKLQELANKYTKINIASCIRTKENKKGSFEKDFYIKGVIICPKCKNERKEDFTKTSLMNYLKDYERDLYICVECKEIKRKEAERQYLAKLALDSDKEATNIYIKNYLTSEKSWKRDLSNYKKMKILRNYGINIHTVAKHIQSLSYYDFLSTPYWKAIAEYKRRKAGFKCELCNSTGILHVHHRTYDIHGYELHKLNDLIVLCEDCHIRFHEE